MLTIITVLLTIALIIDCLFLGLLILVQLPKKDAGVGMAFGGGAADALFGAGSGNTLTKLTKYSAGIFFVLVFVLSTLNIHARNSSGSKLRDVLGSQPLTSGPAQPGAVPAANAVPTATNTGLLDLPASNAAPATVPATNAVTNAPK